MEEWEIPDASRHGLHRSEHCNIPSVTYRCPGSASTDIFIANFISFLRKVNVPIVTTNLTFGFSRDKGRFEWANNSFDAIFCQKTNLFSPGMWRLVFDIIRFNKFALDLLKDEATSSDEHLSSPRSLETVSHYLERHGYSDTFRNNYLIPITASLWRMSPNHCALQFPIVTLVRSM